MKARYPGGPSACPQFLNSHFAGQLTDTAPYVPDNATTPTTVAYAGDTGDIDREVAEGSRVTINITGNRLTPFASLITFRDNLLANDVTALGLDAGLIEAQLDVVLRLRSETGATVRRVDSSLITLADGNLRMRVELSQVEDLDLSQTIVELQISETAYEAALGVAARMMNLSILDFLP
jgi:flagellar hook-associated protein 3 FlgL